jgi:hypothetical protein
MTYLLEFRPSLAKLSKLTSCGCEMNNGATATLSAAMKIIGTNIACSPVVTEIENLLTPVLTRLNCYQVINAEKLSATEFQVTVRSMMGSHPDFVVSQISYAPERIENIPYNDRCYLYIQNNGHWIALHPYVQFKECPLCHNPRVLLADGPYVGHRVNLL